MSWKFYTASGALKTSGRITVPYRYRANNVLVGPSVGTEVTIIDQTIPAGIMGTTGIVDLKMVGDWLNNGAAGRGYVLRIYAGGTKIVDTATTSSITQQTTRRALTVYAQFANLNSASSNKLSGSATLGINNAPTTGISTLATGQFAAAFGSDTVSIDTSVAWNFKVTLQFASGVSESTLDIRIGSCVLEVL